ncbi:zinc finger protein 485-like isoform X2 [Anopheles coustani]|nr:zinc finger protein 485-like isoform X2 [Anopheles coustani]
MKQSKSFGTKGNSFTNFSLCLVRIGFSRTMADKKQLCRICGNEVFAESIQIDSYVESVSLVQMLSYCTSTIIESNDRAPNALCNTCRDDLVIAYKLIVLYHKTSKRWQTLNTRSSIDCAVEQIDVTTAQAKDGSPVSVNPSLVPDPIAATDKSETLQNRNLKNAILDGHPKTVDRCTTCSTCGEKFNNTSELKNHRSFACGMDELILKRLTNERVKCCGCNAEFDNLDHLRDHSNAVHKLDLDDASKDPLDWKHVVCNICYRRYKSRSILLDHKQRPYRTKDHQCVHCGKAFRDRYTLDDHERVHRDDRPFVCGICSKTFALKESYRKHLRLHTFDTDRFKCDVCGKGFRTNGNLTEHQVTHTRQKSLQCSRCPSRFSRKSCLKSHMRLHTGEKPYNCDLCEAKFTFSSDLRRHVMAHNGVKPFACDLCNKAYPRKDYLAKHKASHHQMVNIRSPT